MGQIKNGALIEDEGCMHDGLENGHCIDCGEYQEDWWERIGIQEFEINPER